MRFATERTALTSLLSQPTCFATPSCTAAIQAPDCSAFNVEPAQTEPAITQPSFRDNVTNKAKKWGTTDAGWNAGETHFSFS